MRQFFGTPQPHETAAPAGAFGGVPSLDPADPSVSRSVSSLGARLAVYDSLAAAPRTEDLAGPEAGEFIDRLSARTYELAAQQGGRIPFTVIREVVENLVHAHFTEVVVTILDDGATVRFSDQGPGIPDKERAFYPGFSTASGEMKAVIRGVGSGLPIVREALSFSGGSVEVDDNLGGGTVITLHMESPTADAARPAPGASDDTAPSPPISNRQKQVLSLAMELGSVGPSAVASELTVAVSTAYRDLAHLEDVGLLTSGAAGKRVLTEDGIGFLDRLFGA